MINNLEGLSRKLSDIKECDNEKIHLFSTIQDHGCFVTFSYPDQRIHNASENVERCLKKTHKEILGARIDQILEKEMTAKIIELVKQHPWQVQGHHIQYQKSFDTEVNAYLFETEGLFGLELEFSDPKSFDAEIEKQRILKDFAVGAKKVSNNIERLGDLLCKTVRQVIGMDRVMLYKFLKPTWHGEVIAEDRVTHAHSFYRHRFPSSDIPKPARDLYLRNQVRLISDVDLSTSKVLPTVNPITKKQLDMSDSRLRSAAKIHTEYLKNMGVKATFSVSITVDDNLWGLIACHHSAPINVSHSDRSLCEILSHIFAIYAQMTEEVTLHNNKDDFDIKLKNIFDNIRLSANPLDQLFRQHRSISDAFNIGGIALVNENGCDFAGMTPLRVDIQDLAKDLKEYMITHNKKILAINSMPEFDPKWERIKDQACGVLAVFIPDVKESLMMFYRPEFIQTVTWGGDPRKQLNKQSFKGEINPRESFKAWEEVIKHQAKEWEQHEIEGVKFIRDFVFDVLVKKENLIHELSEKLNKLKNI